MTGIELIAEERREQIEKHGITVKYDAEYNTEEQLANAAELLVAADHIITNDPLDYLPKDWNGKLWMKMWNKPYKERLIIAGALIAAEIDRLQHIEPKQ
jgi:hypothetical protein